MANFEIEIRSLHAGRHEAVLMDRFGRPLDSLTAVDFAAALSLAAQRWGFNVPVKSAGFIFADEA